MIWVALGIIAAQSVLAWVIYFVERADHRRYILDNLGPPRHDLDCLRGGCIAAKAYRPNRLIG